MKKRKYFRVGAILMALALLLVSVPAAGAKTPTLVAVNDSLPFDLTESTMPFYSDRRYYVPYSVFEHSALGIYVSYNRDDRILTMFNSTNSLSFYMMTLDTF
ncbi:MAG: hypothetical protein IJP23_04170, partial [Oscillospiraceae bacterium]|nr:hypothetical protein [Oscillospiraceae bacterium]